MERKSALYTAMTISLQPLLSLKIRKLLLSNQRSSRRENKAEPKEDKNSSKREKKAEPKEEKKPHSKEKKAEKNEDEKPLLHDKTLRESKSSSKKSPEVKFSIQCHFCSVY
jgi:hypothetical protein